MKPAVTAQVYQDYSYDGGKGKILQMILLWINLSETSVSVTLRHPQRSSLRKRHLMIDKEGHPLVDNTPND